MKDKVIIHDKTKWFADELILAKLHKQFDKKHCKFQGKDDTGQVVSDPQKVWEWIEKTIKAVPLEAEVKPDFGGEALKLTGKDLDDLIEIIEIYCRNGYKDLYTKLLKKKLQIVRNISQNSV